MTSGWTPPSVMPVDVQQRADAELGAAWRRCEAALPKSKGRWGWLLQRIERHADDSWDAWAYGALNRESLHGRGPTPAAALDALTEALANR